MKKTKLAFEQLKKAYGLNTPAQIKQRIILDNVLAIANAVYGNDERNKRLRHRYSEHFKLCEKQENLNPE